MLPLSSSGVWGAIAAMQWLKIVGRKTMLVWQVMHAALFVKDENPPPLTAEDSPTRDLSNPGPQAIAAPPYELVETTIGEHARPGTQDLRSIVLEALGAIIGARGQVRGTTAAYEQRKKTYICYAQFRVVIYCGWSSGSGSGAGSGLSVAKQRARESM